MNAPWQIPQTWEWVESREIAEIVGGGTPRTDDSANFDGGDIPWITPADLSGYREKFISRGARNITAKGLARSGARIMPAGTVLFSSRAPIGYVAIASNPVTTNQGFKSFVLHPSIMPDFAYYYLQRAKDLAVNLSSGTTFREISGAKAAQIPFPVAPIAEQQRIVEEIEKQFTRRDAAVAALKRVQLNLKRYRAAVLKAACEGRLVPTEAELARREERSYEHASVLLERILAERRLCWEAHAVTQFSSQEIQPENAKWKGRYKSPDPINDPLNLPEGWTTVSLGHLAWSVKDGPHYSPPYTAEGIPFITGGQVRASGVDFDAAKKISAELHAELSRRCKPEFRDILYTKGGTTGIARVNTYSFEFSVWVHVAVLKLVPSLEAFYVQHALNSPSCYAQARRFTHGVGNQDLGLTRMVKIVFGLPPLAEQKRIVEEVERTLSIIDELEMQASEILKRADALRRAILKNAFLGRLVTQDLSDEPAELLLERIRADGNAAHKSARIVPCGRNQKQTAHGS